MAEVLFYHLTQTSLEEALPGLIERSLGRKWRVLLKFLTEQKRDAFDTHLWNYSAPSFIAHGLDSDPQAAEQPVLLTLDDRNQNGAQVCFCLEGSHIDHVENYERLVVMFDGTDAYQLEAARNYWKELKTEAHQLTYWQQTPEKKWEKKA